ncbi:hypothetical protein Vretifemale_13355, partial [Volvox reticuliferus]
VYMEATARRNGGGASRGAGSREGTRDGRGSVPASRKDRRESGSSRGGRLQDADKVRQPGGDGRGDVRYRRRTTSGDSGGDSNEGRNIERSYGVSSSRSSSSGGGGNAPDLWGLPNQALLAALDRSRLARQQLAEDREEEEEEEEEEAQPDAWAYIHYVSHFYALHLQEWMKLQLQKNVQRRVNEMLVPNSRTDAGAAGGEPDANAAAGAARDGAEDNDNEYGYGFHTTECDYDYDEEQHVLYDTEYEG